MKTAIDFRELCKARPNSPPAVGQSFFVSARFSSRRTTPSFGALGNFFGRPFVARLSPGDGHVSRILISPNASSQHEMNAVRSHRLREVA